MEKKQVRAWWPQSPRPGNFGDILTPIILDKVFGVQPIFTLPPHRDPVIYGVGSIIHRAEGKSVIWGSGAIAADRPVKKDATYLAVRGPRTFELLRKQGIECPQVLGDPAMLMPLIFNEDTPQEYEYGIFAHYVDTELVTSWYGDEEDVLIINPLNADPIEVIKQVLRCKNIISSSLHGIIIAQAYGIPAVWAKHSNLLGGDDIKFHDYYESVNRTAVPVMFKEKKPLTELADFDYNLRGDINLTNLSMSMEAYLEFA